MRNSSGIYSISEVPSFVKGFRKMTDQDFDPRTPCGVRQGSSIAITARGHFNPRTPCGVRRSCHAIFLFYLLFQSTHPLRGATHPALCRCKVAEISIHAPARGATRSATTGAHTFRHFNPRTREGCDLGSPRRRAMERFISIHAPARGATIIRGAIKIA